MPRATSLAAEIEKQTGETPELIAGDGGVYDILRDGKLLFSKHEKGRFPEDEEVLSQLR